jgi:hypothetical protein
LAAVKSLDPVYIICTSLNFIIIRELKVEDRKGRSGVVFPEVRESKLRLENYILQ